VLGVWASLQGHGDTVTTIRGTTHEGRLEFHQGESLCMVGADGARLDIPLDEVRTASIRAADLAAPKRWVLGGAGVLTVNGSFLVRPVRSIDGTKVTFETESEELLLTTQNTAAVFFHPPTGLDLKHLRFDRPGVLLRSRDFMEGTFHSVEKGVVTIESLLLGRRSFSIQNDVTAVFVRKMVGSGSVFSVRTADGSRLQCKKLELAEGRVYLNGSPYRHFQILHEQLVAIRHGDPQSIAELIDERRKILNAGKSEVVVAMEDDPQLIQLTGKRALVLKMQRDLTTQVSQARKDWQRGQQSWSQKKGSAHRAKTNLSRTRNQLKAKERMVTSAQRTLSQSQRDLDEKGKRLKMASQEVDRARLEFGRAGAEGDARRRAESTLMDAERNRKNTERSLSQVKGIHARHLARVTGAQNDHRAALDQARKIEEAEPIAWRELAEALRTRDSAKRTHDVGSAHLREIAGELRSLDEKLRQRGESLQAALRAGK